MQGYQELAQDLKEKWEALTEREGNLRLRDIAARLGVGESQLIAVQVGGGQVIRLEPRFKELFEAFEASGEEFMVSTRNEYAVIEKHGVYRDVEIGEHIGLVLDKEIDLRLFMTHFDSVFFVSKMHRGKVLNSVQFFDKQGNSLHKVYAKKESAQLALDGIVERFKSDNQSPWQEREQAVAKDPETDDSEIDVSGFQQAWRDLQDTHHFFGLLRKFGVSRTQALRLAPESYAIKIEKDALVKTLLEESVERGVPIMVFVGSKGCIEIHTGEVKKVVEMGKWINVLDQRFNLHLDTSGVESSWLVRKPTEDGVVTSLELFDANGEVIAMFFGERKPGVLELESWRSLVEDVCGCVPLYQ